MGVQCGNRLSRLRVPQLDRLLVVFAAGHDERLLGVPVHALHIGPMTYKKQGVWGGFGGGGFLPRKMRSSWYRKKSHTLSVPSSEQVTNLLSDGLKLDNTTHT